MPRTATRRTDDQRAHVPARTCVGCRTIAAKDELLRIVTDDGSAVVDHRQRLPGRGAYVHRTDSCILAAVRRGGLSRSFRKRINGAALEEFMRSREEGQS